MATEESLDLRDFIQNFFASLPDSKADRNKAIVDCATELCGTTSVISEEEIEIAVEGGQSTDDAVRKAKFGVEILTEYNLTDSIDESMITSVQSDLKDYTKYIPLLASFNNLLESACAVEPPDPDPEAVTNFLYATIAFGIEVALWTIGAPYQMAWSGTRFVANRTFLRFARHGCSGCVALLMSELHWAIRGSVYGDVVAEDNIQFAMNEIQGLREDAERWDYDVDLDYSYEEIRDMVESKSGGVVGPMPQEDNGYFDGLLPEFDIPNFDFKLPNLTDLLE